MCRSRRLRQITQTRGFDNSRYHAKTEFNNCFIIHFSNNLQKKFYLLQSGFNSKCALTSGAPNGLFR